MHSLLKGPRRTGPHTLKQQQPVTTNRCLRISTCQEVGSLDRAKQAPAEVVKGEELGPPTGLDAVRGQAFEEEKARKAAALERARRLDLGGSAVARARRALCAACMAQPCSASRHACCHLVVSTWEQAQTCCPRVVRLSLYLGLNASRRLSVFTP